jgi:hypothetical protein
MSWPLVADWLAVTGSLLLTYGTGRQAWASFADIGEQLNEQINEFPKYAQQMFTYVIPNLRRRPGGVGFSLALAVFFASIGLSPLSGKDFRRGGGMTDMANAWRLMRAAVAWFVLMIGAALLLAAVTIQLALAYTG